MAGGVVNTVAITVGYDACGYPPVASKRTKVTVAHVRNASSTVWLEEV